MHFSSSVSLLPSPSPFPAGNEDPNITTTAENSANDAESHIAFLALVPVAVILIVVVVVLGAYFGQEEKGHGDGRLCQLWHRISRRCSRNNTSTSAGPNTGFRGGSTTMLVEELTDINADVWDAGCDCLEEDVQVDPGPQQLTNSSSTSSSSDSEINIYTVSVEVHSNPLLSNGEVHRRGSANFSLATYTDDDVSTQMLDISSSNITSPSCYSDQSTCTSIPSLTSQITVHSTDTYTPAISRTNVSSSGSDSNDTAQEIVDVVQSEGFVVDTAILRSCSSQLSLFSDSESRGYHTDTEPTWREQGDTASAAGGSQEQEQVVIPLSELDGQYGGAIMWEDWEQELHTML